MLRFGYSVGMLNWQTDCIPLLSQSFSLTQEEWEDLRTKQEEFKKKHEV